jgi:diguanylate cyclase (GGDEF)-like protein
LFVHRDGDYALIHVLDPARAAQYSALVEQHHLSGARSRSEEEARFHAQRLGPAALIIAEVRKSPDGFDLLRRLRKGKRPQLAPAVLISGSLQVRNEAIKLKEQLDIVEVLTGSQPLSTVRAAVARAIHRGPRNGRNPRLHEAPPPSQPPLIGAGKEELLQAAARDLGASTALAWFGSPEDGELMGWFGWDTSLVPMIGEREDWAPFRNLAAEAPVYVTDARHDSLLSRSAMVKTGLVRSFAGAPLCNDEGESVGALWVADDRPSQLGTQALHPLSIWAHRLGAAWEDEARKKAVTRLHSVNPGASDEKFKPSITPAMEAMSQVLAHSSDGFIATDGEDRIAYANPAATRLLGLKGRRLMGLTRTHLLELACQKANLAPLVAETLRTTLNATQLVTLHRPQRVLRWETKLLALGTEMGKMDQLVDCTAEVEERETRAKLARIDPLTWLANRRGFEDALAREISRAFRFKTPLTLALFRIDGRSDLEEPDRTQILREVSWLIAEISRGYDQSARLDDDSLALILPGATPEAAKALYKRIAEEVAGLKTRRAKAVTLSTGIALFDPGEDVAQMLGRARAAMLEAEAAGGDTVL